MLRADLLLTPQLIDFYKISLFEGDEGNPAFEAKLRTWAGYGKINAQIGDMFNIDAGVRWEKADQSVVPIQVFKVPGASGAATDLSRKYWLPAATLTVDLTDQMKARLSGSKTIARLSFANLSISHILIRTQTVPIAVTRCWWTASCTMVRHDLSITLRQSSAFHSRHFIKRSKTRLSPLLGVI